MVLKKQMNEGGCWIDMGATEIAKGVEVARSVMAKDGSLAIYKGVKREKKGKRGIAHSYRGGSIQGQKEESKEGGGLLKMVAMARCS